MLLMELFDRDNILCPEWLPNDDIGDWQNSTYSFNNGFHSWTLESPFGTSRICFNGDMYHFQALTDKGEWITIETITKDYVTQI